MPFLFKTEKLANVDIRNPGVLICRLIALLKYDVHLEIGLQRGEVIMNSFP